MEMLLMYGYVITENIVKRGCRNRTASFLFCFVAVMRVRRNEIVAENSSVNMGIRSKKRKHKEKLYAVKGGGIINV
jgi:hypothetical protein